MFSFSVLASGSRANCTFVTTAQTKLLIDCGLSARQTSVRLRAHGVDPQEIQAIVVSHEHSDHIAGIKTFCKQNPAEIYASSQTWSGCSGFEEFDPVRVIHFEAGSSFVVGDIKIEPFSVVHDAVDPVGFRISSGNVTLAVVTDAGQVTALMRDKLQGVQALVIEANHDPLLLEESPYPWELKQRIRGRTGHLSNESAAELLQFLGKSGTEPQYIIAAHISENSNQPEVALEALRAGWELSGAQHEPAFVAASVREATALYCLSDCVSVKELREKPSRSSVLEALPTQGKRTIVAHFTPRLEPKCNL